MKKFLIPMLIATTTAAPLMATVSCAPKKAESFINDSWKTVCYYAKKGLDKLHKAYEADCNANTDFPGTLIGLERKVTINGLEHTVKVVGEEQDYLDEKHEKPVTLTFQFTNLISGTNKKLLSTFWQGGDQQINAHYWNSTLNDALNSTEDVEWRDGDKGHLVDEKHSVYEMIKDGNKDLAKNIKSVDKVVNVDPSESINWIQMNHATKLFCPTIANYYQNDKLPTSYQHLAEGKQYQYYEKKLKDKSAFDANSILLYSDLAQQQSNYWLTSPKIGDRDQIYCIGLSQHGAVINQGCSHQYPVAPCFCI